MFSPLNQPDLFSLKAVVRMPITARSDYAILNFVLTFAYMLYFFSTNIGRHSFPKRRLAFLCASFSFRRISYFIFFLSLNFCFYLAVNKNAFAFLCILKYLIGNLHIVFATHRHIPFRI